jgi:hypothetical protein
VTQTDGFSEKTGRFIDLPAVILKARAS